MRHLILTLVLALALVACESPGGNAAPESRPQEHPVSVAAAPIGAADPYAAAQLVSLPPAKPEPAPGLENLYDLSSTVVSGSEPHGEESFAVLQRKGVRTIVSVDGKAPDVELARRYGMRYVHVPIQYKTITDEERLHLAKTFRELEPPFYVHCFHGKHRGPAAAAVGRVVLDGATREQALAEMRQYAGTSSKYAGLYATIANAPMPSEADTATCSFDFPEAVRFAGVRDVMIPLPRAYDHLAALAERDFAMDPHHPDVDAVNEAATLKQLLEHADGLEETAAHEADFRSWMADSVSEARKLHTLLTSPAAQRPETIAEARLAVEALGALCSACHASYRN